MTISKLNINDLANLCSMSYYNDNHMKNIYYQRPIINSSNVLYKLNNKPQLYEGNIDSQMYICEYDDILTIIFRGTESNRDIISDINILKVDIPIENTPNNLYPQVHSGFYNQFLALNHI